MNGVLFAKMDPIFSLKKTQNILKILEKSGKVREFFQSGIVGTMSSRKLKAVSRNKNIMNK